MDLDLKLDKVIEAIDLVKRLSWGAIPLWFALTLPIVYAVYSKLLPEKKQEEPEAAGTVPPPAGNTPEPSRGEKRWKAFRQWISLPRVEKWIVYASLALFVIGTITLLIDQHQKEKIRNNGLRLKQYFTSKNFLALNRSSLVAGAFRLANLSSPDIDQVLELYPGEFMEVQENLITLRDSTLTAGIMAHCERLLDSYLSNPSVSPRQDIDSLFAQSDYFTREVVYQLLIDSPHKYTYLALNKRSSILAKR